MEKRGSSKSCLVVNNLRPVCSPLLVYLLHEVRAHLNKITVLAVSPPQYAKEIVTVQLAS
jgi:hypothetical protein